MLPELVQRRRAGTDLRQLVAAGALANARTFGGEDYVGFHTMMALAPAYRMVMELPKAQQPLPVLKVLYRNNQRIRQVGGRKAEVLRPVEPATAQQAEDLEKVRKVARDQLIAEAESAIRAGDQARTCALVHRYGELDRPTRQVLDLLLRYAVSEDGALHAEKYYRTVAGEFGSTRKAFRWRQLTALARVTASEYGRAAPGYVEACELLEL